MAAEAASVKRSSKERFLWVLEDGRIRPLKVTVGLNDGVSTEIVSGDLREGMEVVTRCHAGRRRRGGGRAGKRRQPFLPKPPKRGKTAEGSHETH